VPRTPDLQLHALWRDRVRRQTVSGLTIAQFCAQKYLSQASFSAWKRRLRTDARKFLGDPKRDEGSSWFGQGRQSRTRSATAGSGRRMTISTGYDVLGVSVGRDPDRRGGHGKAVVASLLDLSKAESCVRYACSSGALRAVQTTGFWLNTGTCSATIWPTSKRQRQKYDPCRT
jgi:hypothetical protein